MTITLDSLPMFLIDLSQRLVKQKEITIKFLPNEDSFLDSDEYLDGKESYIYDMTQEKEKNKFFSDLKKGK